MPIMPLRFFRLLALVLIASGHPLLADEYRKIVDNGVTFHAFIAKPSELNIHWKSADGIPIRKLDSLAAILESDGQKIQFLGNAGAAISPPSTSRTW